MPARCDDDDSSSRLAHVTKPGRGSSNARAPNPCVHGRRRLGIAFAMGALMGTIDQFAAGHVAHMLVHGEAIQWIVCLMEPTEYNVMSMPIKWRRWIGVGTNVRLIALEAVEDLFSLSRWGNVKAQVGKEVRVWWYDELGEVKLLPGHVGSGRSFYLNPFVNCGPLAGKGERYYVMPGIDGFDAQNQVGTPYIDWLADTVMRRGFAMDPQKRAHLAPLIHAWEQRMIAERVAAARNAEHSKRGAKIFKWMLAVGAYVLLMCGCGLAYVGGKQDIAYWGDIVEKNEEVRSYREKALADLEKGKGPTKACDFKGYDAWQCVCVSAEEGKERTTTNAKRKLDPTLGMSCLDAAGLKSELKEAAKYDEADDARVATGEKLVLGATIGGIVATFLGILALALKLRKPRGTPAAPAAASA